MRIVSGIIVVSTIAFLLVSCKSGTGFYKGISPYTKSDTSEYSYEINSDNLSIISGCSDLKITKGDTTGIKINIKKTVGGKDEEKLQQALDNIKCTFENNVIKIGPENNDESIANSRNIQATISIPNSITSLDIQSDVGAVGLDGNYDNLTTKVETGSLSYKGELKQANIFSNVGDIQLNLNHLESNYKYVINGGVGDVHITIPKGSLINITGKADNDIKVGNGIKQSSNGATFDINTKVSGVKIDS